VNCSCVSLDGDSFSPSGVMSGGSTDKKKLLLPILDKSREARATLEQKQQELHLAERQANQSKQVNKIQINAQ
jgi:chromosome segregation ATPase